MGNIDVLKQAGMDVDSLPAEQREALAGLDQSELDALVAIREKLNAEPEVGGYSLTKAADGNVVW